MIQNPELFGMVAVHSPWQPSQVRHARFIRWAVLNQRITDADTSDSRMAEIALKGHHVYPFTDAPCPWDAVTAKQFEGESAE